MNSFIYKITNLDNGKCYVGFTRETPHIRWRNHVRQSRLDKERHTYLHSAIRKYGEDRFTVEVLEEGEANHLLSVREEYWISEIKPEYNLTEGGNGVVGYKHTEETKKKITGRPKGVKGKVTQAVLDGRKRTAEKNRGRKHTYQISEEVREQRRQRMIELNKKGLMNSKGRTPDAKRDSKGRFI